MSGYSEEPVWNEYHLALEKPFSLGSLRQMATETRQTSTEKPLETAHTDQSLDEKPTAQPTKKPLLSQIDLEEAHCRLSTVT